MLLQLTKTGKSKTFSFQEIDSQEVRSLRYSMDGRKSTCEDRIPPKLVSLDAAELEIILTNATNMSIRSCKIPEKAKQAVICPLANAKCESRIYTSNFPWQFSLTCFFARVDNKQVCLTISTIFV